MRKARFWLVVFGLFGLAAATKILLPGGAAWAPDGRLMVADTPKVLPRWVYSRPAEPSVAVSLPLMTREGAKVEAKVRVTFPPGSHFLPPAREAQEGLQKLLERSTPPLDLDCLADFSQAGCASLWRRHWQEQVASQLGLETSQVDLSISADNRALAAARLAKLRTKVRPQAPRVLLVGWDGADWELLLPLAHRGVMPVLQNLLDHGTWGKLASFTPLLSPLIWTTIATGEPPERHGVLDFLEVDPDSGVQVPITGRKRKLPALWNIASAMGFTVAVSGWWASWPAEAVNGVLVSDRLFFLLADATGEAPMGTVVFPPEKELQFQQLARQAEEQTDERAVRALLPVSHERFARAQAEQKGMADPVDGFRRILVGTRVYLGAALELLQARPQLTMVYVMGTDEVGHVLAPHLPPALGNADPSVTEVAKQGVERYFAVVDRWLGRLLQQCPLAECAVVLVSDHGFKWGADRPREFSGVAAATAALWHRPEGIFLVAGSGVTKKGKVSAPSSVFDVAPTVLALLGVPPGQKWQGRPLPGVQVPSVPPVPWEELLPPESYRPQVAGVSPSPEYVAQLKALGYLEGSEGGENPGQVTEGELNNLGLVHLEAKRYQEAEEAFRQAVAKNPAYASPYYNLRRLYFETGRYDEADAALEQAIQRGLRDGVGAMARAVADYRQANLPDRALGLAKRARKLFPGEARFVAQLLAILVELGRCQEGLDEAHSSVTQFSQDPGVLSFAGLAAACAGDPDLARKWMQQSLLLLPHQPELERALAALGEKK